MTGTLQSSVNLSQNVSATPLYVVLCPAEGGGLPQRLLSFWGGLSVQQRIYTVLAAGVALWLLPSLLVLLVVALERLFVGGMLAMEQAFVAAIISSAAAVRVIDASKFGLSGEHFKGQHSTLCYNQSETVCIGLCYNQSDPLSATTSPIHSLLQSV